MKFKWMKTEEVAFVQATDNDGELLLEAGIVRGLDESGLQRHEVTVRTPDGVMQVKMTVEGGWNKTLRSVKGLMSGLMSRIGHHGRQRANAAKKAAVGAAAAEYAVDLGSGELKSRRLQLLMKPSLVDWLMRVAVAMGISVNELVNRIVGEAMNKEVAK